jgi:hypothetical protein
MQVNCFGLWVCFPHFRESFSVFLFHQKWRIEMMVQTHTLFQVRIYRMSLSVGFSLSLPPSSWLLILSHLHAISHSRRSVTSSCPHLFRFIRLPCSPRETRDYPSLISTTVILLLRRLISYSLGYIQTIQNAKERGKSFKKKRSLIPRYGFILKFRSDKTKALNSSLGKKVNAALKSRTPSNLMIHCL